MSSLPHSRRGEGTRPSASPRPSLSLLSVTVLALLAAAGCHEGYEAGQPWMPDNAAAEGGTDANGDGSTDDGTDGDDGDDANSADNGAGTDADDRDGNDETSAEGDDGAMDDGPMDDGEPPPADVPDIPDIQYCDDVATAQPQWSQFELDVLALTNMYRAQGANCGSAGSFGPADPLVMQPNLRCSARVHSKDMDARNFFAHTNPSGQSPYDRMSLAGYSYVTAAENIAAGASDAAGTMDQWMNSDGHCANIMNRSFTELGVGYHPGGAHGTLWTQNFGT